MSKLIKFVILDYDQRWKMLHYSALDFFAPIIVVPEIEISNNLTIYLVSDILIDLEVILNVEVYNWESNIPLTIYTTDIILLVGNLLLKYYFYHYYMFFHPLFVLEKK